VKLLNRTRRSVALTPTGRIFLTHARRLLADANELGEIARRAQSGAVGQLAVGFVHSAGYGFLPPLVREFRMHNPGVVLTLHEQTVDQQAIELERRGIDVGLARPGAFDRTVKNEFLLREPFVIALPESHPGARIQYPSLRRFAGEYFISFPRHRAPVLYDSMIRLCANAGFVPKIQQVTDTMNATLGLVGADVGIAIVPGSVTLFQVPSVAFRLPKETEPQSEMTIAHRLDDDSPVVARFVEAAKVQARTYEKARLAVLKSLGAKTKRG
jgi:DNA-binding transcriptional LysR family regulator